MPTLRHYVTIRATAFPVTTTADEEDFSCDPDAPDGDGNLEDGVGGTGRSLREALESCPLEDLNGIVYVPAGTYTLSDDLDSQFDNVHIIGEDPLTTIVENSSGTISPFTSAMKAFEQKRKN